MGTREGTQFCEATLVSLRRAVGKLVMYMGVVASGRVVCGGVCGAGFGNVGSEGMDTWRGRGFPGRVRGG